MKNQGSAITKKLKSILSFGFIVFFIFSFNMEASGLPIDQQELIQKGILYYDISNDSSCDGSGNIDLEPGEGPLTGVFFPNADPAQLEVGIKKYINDGWPASPLKEYADDFVRYGKQYNVNPLIPVIIAQVEYQFGTARTDLVGTGGPGQYNFWAVTHNSNSSTRFGPYPSIDTAMEEHFKLLSGKSASANSGITYIGPPQNFRTISDIMNQYAPSFENDTPRYIQTIVNGMREIGESAVSEADSIPKSSSASDSETSNEIQSASNCSSNDSSQTISNSNCDAVGQSSTGFVFPLCTTKKLIKSGVQFNSTKWTWCYSKKTSCHHDYAAADIHVEPGTLVLAPINGVIYKVDDPGSCDGSFNSPRVQLKARSGKYFYFTHMKPGSIDIKEGQNINAGDKIGEVGEGNCAQNTGPHLHIHRSSQPTACAGTSGCSQHADYNANDIQPDLYTAFQGLSDE